MESNTGNTNNGIKDALVDAVETAKRNTSTKDDDVYAGTIRLRWPDWDRIATLAMALREQERGET